MLNSMNKYLLHIVLFFCLTQQFYSQEDGVVALDIPVRNSLKFNRFVINPTFSFVREQNKYISFNNKRQWVQFDNAPQTYLFSYAGRFKENIGLGFGLFQQDYGVLTTFGGVLNLAYNASINRDNNLTFGLNLGFYQSGINDGKVITNFPDPSLQNIPSNSLITINPGINYGTDFLDFGVSIKNLVSYNFNTSKIIEDNPEQSIQGHIMYTGYTNSSGFFDESKFSGLIRSEFKKDKTVISGIMMLTVPKGVWAQVGYNTLYGASAGIGFNITEQIAIEYNFEKAIGDLSTFGNSHDITLAYKFKNRFRYNYSGDDNEEALFTPTKKSKRVVANKVATKTLTPEEREQATAEAKARIEERRLAAQAKAEERKQNADASLKAEKAAQAELLAKEKANEQAKLKEEAEAQSKLEEEAQAQLLAEEKAKADEEAKLKLAEETKAKAQARAKAEEEAKAKAKTQAEETKLRLEAEARAKADEEAKLKLEAQVESKRLAEEAQAKIDAENKAKADAKRLADEAQAKEQARIEQERLEAEQKADTLELDGVLVPIARDREALAMESLTKLTTDTRLKQQDLLVRLRETVANRQQDLDDLKEENDLSEQGIVKAPKPFKSVSAENAALQTLKIEIDESIKSQNEKITTLENLYNERLKTVSNTNDSINAFYLKTIKNLKTNQTQAIKSKENLILSLETIDVATEIERKRRIKRAAYDNEEVRYEKDRAALNQIKQNTSVTSVPLNEEDFDFGEELNSNIKIVKGVKNEESGYYLVVAVHSDIAKRDDFLAKTLSAGQSDINFFYDVNSSKYYIYYNKFDDIESAKRAMESKENKPYNSKMSMVKIEN